MYCHQCGKEVSEDAVFCRFCGTKLNLSKQEESVQQTYNSSSSIENVEKGPWKNFATTGFVLGIISICTFFMISPAIMCGIPGIVFAALGRRSEVNNSKATTGLVLSILGTILGICFPFIILMISVGLFG